MIHIRSQTLTKTQALHGDYNHDEHDEHSSWHDIDSVGFVAVVVVRFAAVRVQVVCDGNGNGGVHVRLRDGDGDGRDEDAGTVNA